MEPLESVEKAVLKQRRRESSRTAPEESEFDDLAFCRWQDDGGALGKGEADDD